MIVSLSEEGYWPDIKNLTDGRKVIRMRTRRNAKTISVFTKEKWDEAVEIYKKVNPDPERKDDLAKTETKQTSGPKYALKSTDISLEISLGKDVKISENTLLYWAWARRNRNYDGTISDFINEVIEFCFMKQGIEPVIVVKNKEGAIEKFA